MTAIEALNEAMLSALSNAADFGGVLNGVFAGPAVKATMPYAELGELLVGDWGAKDLRGFELRPVILIRDATDTPARLHALVAAADAAMAALPRDLGGWRIASLVLVRQRVARAGPGQWEASADYRVRMIETF
jgi:hypothetical protein